jgi:DNA-binding SARP family transcriptional activator
MSADWLHLHLLGLPRVAKHNQDLKLTRKGLALLVYLAIQGATSREKMAEMLWGEFGQEGAGRNLRRELHRLRETAVQAHLETSQNLNLTEFVWADQAPQHAGELLEGLDLPDAPAFMAWLEQQRQQRQQQRLAWLQCAAEQASGEQQTLYCQEIFRLEPMSQAATQTLLHNLIGLGQYETAKQVFLTHKNALAELGLLPSSEVLSLLQIGNRAALHQDAAKTAVQNNQPHQALKHLEAALLVCETPQERFWLHHKRLQLLNTTGQIVAMPPELELLEQAAHGDALLEAIGWTARAAVEFQQLEFQKALQSAQIALENPLLPKIERATASYYAGVCLIRLGQLAAAEPMLSRALHDLPELNSAERIRAHHGLSQLALQRGDVAAARDHNQAAADLLSLEPDRAMRSGVLAVSGVLAMMAGEYPKAVRLLESAKRDCEQSQNTLGLSMVLANLAKAQIETGELAAAIESLEQGLGLARSQGNRILEGQMLNNLAVTHLERGNLGVALETHSAALEFAKQIGDARSIALRHLSLVDVLTRLGETKESAQHLLDTEPLVEKLPDVQPWWNIQQSEWLMVQQRYPEAHALLFPLHEHPDIEIRLNARFLSAKCWLAQQQPMPADFLLEHSSHPKWGIKILTLKGSLSAAEADLVRPNLARVPALERLGLLGLLGETTTNLELQLFESLEQYPDLQALWQKMQSDTKSVTMPA